MSLRFDMLYGFSIARPPSVVMMDSSLDTTPMWNGLPVYQTTAAKRYVWRVERAGNQRRRRWRPVKRMEPCIFTSAQGIYVHPSLRDKFRKATLADTGSTGNG